MKKKILYFSSYSEEYCQDLKKSMEIKNEYEGRIWLIGVGNCFLHHITAPDSSGKDETILKKNFRNMCSGFFFPERNFILRIFLSGMSFSFLFLDFYFRNTIISFPDFFFQNVLFINSRFFCPKQNFKFCFRIFISET